MSFIFIIDAYNLGYQIEIVKPAVVYLARKSSVCSGHFSNIIGSKITDENSAEIETMFVGKMKI